MFTSFVHNLKKKVKCLRGGNISQIRQYQSASSSSWSVSALCFKADDLRAGSPMKVDCSHQLNHSLNNDKLMLQYHSRCLHLYLLTLPDYLLLLVDCVLLCWCWWCCSADVSSVTTQCLPLSTQPRTTHTVGHSTHKYFTNQPRQKYFNQAQLENISSTCLEKYLTGMKQRKLFDCPGIRMLRTLSLFVAVVSVGEYWCTGVLCHCTGVMLHGLGRNWEQQY